MATVTPGLPVRPGGRRKRLVSLLPHMVITWSGHSWSPVSQWARIKWIFFLYQWLKWKILICFFFFLKTQLSHVMFCWRLACERACYVLLQAVPCEGCDFGQLRTSVGWFWREWVYTRPQSVRHCFLDRHRCASLCALTLDFTGRNVPENFLGQSTSRVAFSNLFQSAELCWFMLLFYVGLWTGLLVSGHQRVDSPHSF